jgi:hypothetical protein
MGDNPHSGKNETLGFVDIGEHGASVVAGGLFLDDCSNGAFGAG